MNIIKRELAKNILKREVYSELLSWIEDIKEYDADYTVFVVRRSFVLVQILEDVWEQEKGEKLNDFFYITDSAILTACEQIADFYRHNGCFPSILLCDDILLHGRNINNLIADIENRMRRLLPEADERVLLYQLERAVRVWVYTCSKDGILLDKRYEMSLRAYRKENVSFLHVLSGNISSLILNSKVANASYVCSAFFDKDAFLASITGHGWIRTDYQNTVQYSIVLPAVSQYGDIGIICSYRATVKGDGMELVPFAFLPQINADETECLYHDILKRMQRKGYSRDYVNIVNKLYSIEGRRAFYELLSFIHSGALLNDFFRSYNANCKKDYDILEMEKLSRNYFMGEWGLTKSFLKELVSNPLIADMDDFKKHVYICMYPSTYIIAEKEYNRLQWTIDDKAKARIREQLENLFFWQGMKEEVEAKKVLNSPSVREIQKLKRTVYGCAYVISALVSETRNLNFTMAYFMQMMDAGVIGISSNGGTRGIVDGFCQFEKAGEQSLLTQPIRNLRYIPFLNLLCDFCRELALDKKAVLNEFCIKYNLQAEYKQIELFLDILDNMGQHPGDWMGDYNIRVSEGERSGLIKMRNNYLKLFESFIVETPRNYLIERGRIRDEENKNRQKRRI